MSEKLYEVKVNAGAYSDGSGFAAKAKVEPGDDGEPVVIIDVTYRITADQWDDFKTKIDEAFEFVGRLKDAA